MLAFSVMVPVNWTNGTLEHSGLTYSDIDKLSISNVPTGSPRYETFTNLCDNSLPPMFSVGKRTVVIKSNTSIYSELN